MKTNTSLKSGCISILFFALFFVANVSAKTIDCTLIGNANGVPDKISINYQLKTGMTNRFNPEGITVEMNRNYTQSARKMLGGDIQWTIKGSGYLSDYALDGFKYIEGTLKAGDNEVGEWQFIATDETGRTWNLVRVSEQQEIGKYTCQSKG